MYSRFAKKYGSKEDVMLPPPGEEVEEVVVPKNSNLPEIKHDPEAMKRMFFKQPARPRDTIVDPEPWDSEDNSFEEGFEAGLEAEEGGETTPDPLMTEVMPGIKSARYSRHDLITLCNVFYDLATS